MWRSILALLGTVAFAHSVPVPKLAIEHYQLPNGRQVVLCPDKKFPLVQFDLRVYAGSKHERPGRSGLAHLVEHLMFEAVEGAGTFNDAVERIGGSGVNAETH